MCHLLFVIRLLEPERKREKELVMGIGGGFGFPGCGELMLLLLCGGGKNRLSMSASLRLLPALLILVNSRFASMLSSSSSGIFIWSKLPSSSTFNSADLGNWGFLSFWYCKFVLTPNLPFFFRWIKQRFYIGLRFLQIYCVLYLHPPVDYVLVFVIWRNNNLFQLHLVFLCLGPLRLINYVCWARARAGYWYLWTEF